MWVWAETRVVFWDDWTSSILILMRDDVGSIQNVSFFADESGGYSCS